MASPGQDRTTRDTPWWSERWFIAAGAVLALIVALGVVVAISGGGTKSTTAAPPTDASPPAAGSTRAAPVASNSGGCSLKAGSQVVPTSAPPNTRWELVGSMAAPSAPALYGPEKDIGGFRTCYADSPTGALFAAVGFWAAGTALPDADVLQHLAAHTAVRNQAIRDARARGSVPSLANGSHPQIAGFSFLSYSPSTATINIAFRVQNGLVTAPTTMQWEAGDWRYVIPPTGNPGGGQVPTLDGYVAWGTP